MSQTDVKELMTSVLEQLESEGAPLEGLTLDGLRDAVMDPRAADEIATLMEIESRTVGQGDPAPDFCLPYLDAERSGQTMKLSDHFGQRPVGLIFGSYT